jgi:hypothetical protein
MKQIRRRKPAAFWEMHIKQWQEQGSRSVPEYCKEHGLLVSQFKHWLTKYPSKDAQEVPKLVLDPNKWVRVMTHAKAAPNETIHCELEFGNGSRLIIKSQAALAMLKDIIPLVQC